MVGKLEVDELACDNLVRRDQLPRQVLLDHCAPTEPVPIARGRSDRGLDTPNLAGTLLR